MINKPFLYKLTCPKDNVKHSNYDKNKIMVMNLFLFLSIFTLLITSVINSFNGEIIGTIANSIAIIVSGCLLLYFRISNNYLSYKVGLIILSSFFFLYIISYGGIDNTGPLWCYIFPILIYYILGNRHGTVALLIVILLYIVILFYPDFPLLFADYPINFKIRFIISTIFVSILAFALEYARSNAYNMQEILIHDLQEALEEIDHLNGLIPICSRCKKVKTGSGYWEQVESYIEKRSKLSFTHSICKKCSDELYGQEEWYDKDKFKDK